MADRDSTADDTPPPRADERSDLEQIVEARADAVARGEGGTGKSPLADPGTSDGAGGTGGVVKNQDQAAQ